MVFPYTDSGATEEERLTQKFDIEISKKTDKLLEPYIEKYIQIHSYDNNSGIEYDKLIQFALSQKNI